MKNNFSRNGELAGEWVLESRVSSEANACEHCSGQAVARESLKLALLRTLKGGPSLPLLRGNVRKSSNIWASLLVLPTSLYHREKNLILE